MDMIKHLVNIIKPSHPILIANIEKGVIPTYLLGDKPVKPKPVEPKPVEPKPVEPVKEGEGGSSLWFIVILVMAIILMNSYER